MTLALDLGSDSFRSLRREGGRLVARKFRAAYSIVPDSGAQRRLLEGARIPFAACEGSLVLLGEGAVELSRSFQAPYVELLPGGVVPEADPIARQLIALLIDALLPSPASPAQICCLTVPRQGAKHGSSREGQPDFLSSLIRLRGYTPLLLGSGMALIYAELVRERFAGIGLVLGRGGAEISIAHSGKEVCSCSIPHGIDWIEEHSRKAAAIQSQAGGAPLPQSGDGKFPAAACEEMVAHLVREFTRVLAGESALATLPRPLNLVCGGESAHIPGFCALLRRHLEQSAFPSELGEVRLASDSPSTVARGCLIHAELEAAALANRHGTRNFAA